MEYRPHQPTPSSAQPPTREETHLWLMWALLGIGLLLVVFADSLAAYLTHSDTGGTIVGDRIALTLRILGVLSFLSGLVERLLIQIPKELGRQR